MASTDSTATFVRSPGIFGKGNSRVKKGKKEKGESSRKRKRGVERDDCGEWPVIIVVSESDKMQDNLKDGGETEGKGEDAKEEIEAEKAAEEKADESEEVKEDTSEEEDTEEDEETDENAKSDLNSDSITRSEEKNVVESDESFESEKEALKMLQTEKTPKRSSAVIRKELAEKAAAEVKAKLEADLETAKQRASVAETAQKKAEEARKTADESAKKADEALKKAQTDLGALQGVSEENTNLKTKVGKLEKEAAQAQKTFAATLEAEQNRLVAESDADNDARMKIAWAALYPNADYSVWALAHRYAEYVVYLRDRGEPEPDSFEPWVNSNNEPSAPQLPGPGEAQDIPSDDEEED
ncbi:troponin T, fast skeletal muscle-like [Chenopodium quinoa]|uniref:troponin T, fast skeletal muscle-like n=1 Tax=Chenopodium quinoa TaxID=63459 RepID=UPI000B7721B7|nr:troponin T, fast skeletal muscle-like [Chenopodium quinoa]